MHDPFSDCPQGKKKQLQKENDGDKAHVKKQQNTFTCYNYDQFIGQIIYQSVSTPGRWNVETDHSDCCRANLST